MHIYQDILGHKATFNKFKRTETIQSISFDHSGIRVEIKRRKQRKKISKHLETTQHSYKVFMGQRGSLKGNLKGLN